MAVTEDFKQGWIDAYWNTVLPFYSRLPEHQGLSEHALFDRLWEERYRFQTDLFWAAKYVLNYDLIDAYICFDHLKEQSSEPGNCPRCQKPFSTYWHQDKDGLYPAGSSPHRLITDFFIKKNPDKTIGEQDTIRDRLLMSPRGTLKSSIDQADCVQWIVNFPDIRILVLSAAENYSTDFVNTVRDHFVRLEKEDGKKKQIVTLSWFQCLFIEHTVSSFKKEMSGEFTTNARTSAFKGIEPTIFAFGLKATKSGYHAEVGKFDDCVSDANSGPIATDDTREKVAKTIRLARGLILPRGYGDSIGTPYHEQDAYTPMIAHAELHPEELKFLRRTAWYLKAGSRGKREDELGPNDYDLFFPAHYKSELQQSYEFLLKMKRESEASDDNVFPCQYLCEPRSVRNIKFNDYLIRSHALPPDQYQSFPQLYTTVAVWDLAYSRSKNRKRDYSVGSVGWFDPFGRLFVKDVVRGQFGKYELAVQIAKQAARWKVQSIYVEGSNGADFLETDIRRELLNHGYPQCPLVFFPVDTSAGAKNTRAELLEGMFINNTLFLSSEIPILEDVISEFVKFTANGSRKDDIVDSIAHLARFAPPAEEIPKTEQDTQQALYDILRHKVEMERVFSHPEVPIEEPKPLPMDYFESEYGRVPLKTLDDWVFGK